MTRKNYYQILDVPYTATSPIIKQAYKRLVLRYHPDVSETPNAEERFKEIVEAYRTLSDSYKRFDYDREISPSSFYTAQADDINEDSSKADFMEEPLSDKFKEAIKDIFSKVKISFNKPARPKTPKQENRKLNIDPTLKRMNEEELYERLSNSSNYYVQLNAVYALAEKKNLSSRSFLQSAFMMVGNIRLKAEILKLLPPHNTPSFITHLASLVEHTENDLAKEIILYCARVSSKESLSVLESLRKSPNKFIRKETASLYATKA